MGLNYVQKISENIVFNSVCTKPNQIAWQSGWINNLVQILCAYIS